jgi:hypothetical protein
MLRGVEIIIIRKRLSQIEVLSPMSDNNPPPEVEKVYDDLLELARLAKPDTIRFHLLTLFI